MFAAGEAAVGNLFESCLFNVCIYLPQHGDLESDTNCLRRLRLTDSGKMACTQVPLSDVLPTMIRGDIWRNFPLYPHIPGVRSWNHLLEQIFTYLYDLVMGEGAPRIELHLRRILRTYSG